MQLPCFTQIFNVLILLPQLLEAVPARPVYSNTLIIETGSDQNQQKTMGDPPALPVVLNELKAHFSRLDTARIGHLSEQLQRFKQLAHQKGYGQRRFSLDAEEDRLKPVSISPSQPNTSAEMAQLLFEGDILLMERQLGLLLAHLQGIIRKLLGCSSNDIKIIVESLDFTKLWPKVPMKRSLSADPEALWQRMPIKFKLHESLDLSAIQQIVEAIAYWENNTCVQFEHLEQEPAGEQDFVEFFKGQGCYSMIGRYGGRQGVSIGAGCERVGIVEHEIGHVLGLWHEQSRPDAWKYVHVEKASILPSYMADFQLRGADEILTLGLPYDYGSVMHYGPTAFSSDGNSVTLMTKNILFQATIGQRDRLAFYDLMSINKAYCADKCGGIGELQLAGYHPPKELSDEKRQPQAKCLNGGYPNPGRCQQCLCPSGYGGDRCEKAQPAKKASCGGEVLLEEQGWAELESPGYSDDGYEPGQQCNWIVRAPTGSRVQAEFVGDFGLLCATICLDYVELKLAKDQRLTGARFCCDRKPKGTLVSEHNQIAILFRAQLTQDVGFRLKLRATTLPATSQRTGKNMPDEGSIENGGGPKVLPGKDVWSAWGDWSACSRPCGGCGIRSRVRTCLSAQCPTGQPQEFSACNLQACPVRPNCHKVVFLNRLCHSALSDSPAICTQLSSQLARCNQPSCCPPFYALNGKCVTNEDFRDLAALIGGLE